MKYIVMECNLSHAVVLSDDGQFLKVANMRYEVGQTVEEVVPMQTTEVHSRRPVRWLAPVTSLAACLLLVVAMMFFRAPYASVYLTINPEVRIDVNRSDIVVGVEGVNEDGIVLLDGYEFRKKHLDTVMDELVDRAIDMGYLSDGGTVTVTLDADEDWVVNHSDALNTHLNEYLTEKISVTIEITGPVHHEAVIPTEPGHHDTDYGSTDYGTEPPPVSTPVDDGQHTDYSDDGITDYGHDHDDGDHVTDEHGDSDYNEDDDDEDEEIDDEEDDDD